MSKQNEICGHIAPIEWMRWDLLCLIGLVRKIKFPEHSRMAYQIKLMIRRQGYTEKFTLGSNW